MCLMFEVCRRHFKWEPTLSNIAQWLATLHVQSFYSNWSHSTVWLAAAVYLELICGAVSVFNSSPPIDVPSVDIDQWACGK
mmetsp:Transcript_52894/g.146557  ORF Transcript_52894/g.146557 Transcript_52894/m.146557 type:complete len:81 (+) Transcript_52894:97-339(+)